MAKFDSIENIRVSNNLNSKLNLIRIDLDLFETITDNDELIKNKVNFHNSYPNNKNFKLFIFQTISFGFLKDDYKEFLYILQGYLRLLVYPLKNRLCPIQEIESTNPSENLNGK